MLIGYNEKFEVRCIIEEGIAKCKDERVNNVYFPTCTGVDDGEYIIKGSYNRTIDKVHILPRDIIKVN